MKPGGGLDLITKLDPGMDPCGFRLLGMDPGSGRLSATWVIVVVPLSLILRGFSVMLLWLAMAC